MEPQDDDLVMFGEKLDEKGTIRPNITLFVRTESLNWC